VIEETNKEAYERGAVAGEISARLAGHDTHFAAINGHLAEMIVEIREMKMSMQRIEDAGDARAADHSSTGAAIKESTADRRARVEQWYFLVGMIGVFLAVALSALSIYLVLKQ
jgi:hypothetical protein